MGSSGVEVVGSVLGGGWGGGEGAGGGGMRGGGGYVGWGQGRACLYYVGRGEHHWVGSASGPQTLARGPHLARGAFPSAWLVWSCQQQKLAHCQIAKV